MQRFIKTLLLFILFFFILRHPTISHAAYEGEPILTLSTTDLNNHQEAKDGETLNVGSDTRVDFTVFWPTSELDKMDNNHSYTYHLKVGNAGSIDIPIENRSCHDIKYNKPEIFGNSLVAGCEVIGGTGFLFRNSILTTKLPSKTLSYAVTVTSDGVTREKITLSIIPKSIFISFDPPSPFYEDTKITISASNCSKDSKVDFMWWRGEDAVRKVLEDSKNNTENPGDGIATNDNDSYNDVDVDDSTGLASFCKGSDCGRDAFGSDSKEEPYIMRAICQSTKKVALQEFKVKAKGKEYTRIMPENPEENTSFTITVTGLEGNDQCYFFKIKNKDTGEYIRPSSEPEITCGDNAIDTGGGGRDHHKQELYKTFVSTNLEESFPIAEGLAKGKYEFTLYTANRDTILIGDQEDGANKDPDDKHDSATLGFEVGAVKTPPPGPPCLKYQILNEDGTPSGEDLDYHADNPPTGGDSNNKDLRFICTKTATAFGSISTDPAGFVSSVLALLLSISGGIALLLIIRSAYQMMTSQGNPEAIQEARERITSAIVGLLFIIFSLVILQVIGVDILKIPGFGN